MFQTIVEFLAIVCFVVLTGIGAKNGQWDYAGMNFSLVILYIFLYIAPFTKFFK